MSLRRAAALAAASLLIAVQSAGCARELPEKGSADEELYAARCGSCHKPHHPQALTPAMWKVQVDRMDAKYRTARLPVPSNEERERILSYLTRNAGG